MKPRGTVVRMRPRAVATAAPDTETERLHQRVEELEGALRGQGPLFALLRLLRAGRQGVNWENVARLWAALYFSWHSEETDEFGYDRKFTETVMPIFEFLYTVWWRVEVSGVESVPETGPGLIVGNHSGVLPYDGLMIRLAVRHEHPARREARLLALDMFALLPFLAPLLQRTGAVRASQENGERLLRQGELVGVFPEGVKGVGKPFKSRYRLARFGRGGFVRLALRTGAAIVPCAVVGAEEIHPNLMTANWLGRPLGLPYLPITPTFPLLGPLGFVPLPTKWTIDFAEPIPVAEYGPEGADDPILVNRLCEEVRGVIQRMIDGRLARRRSIWFG
ncbi:MAG TPA: lysophospholipid acyltransferase family protein [Vicinamibacteria bacterium]|nr:lysophospholipid acyltransferase family protein [Vicinamibacteria bacterium]